MGCTSSRALDPGGAPSKGRKGPRTIKVNRAREDDIAQRLETAIKPDVFVVGVASVTAKMHRWGERAKAEVAAHGSQVRYPQNDTAKTREDKILAGLKLLNERLHAHMLWSEESLDDGNCQFRSVASQFYGNQKWHMCIRAATCDHMERHREYYSIFFASADEFDRFVASMRQSSTWGNELTLRAITDCFGVVVHVVTSTAENWYLTYRPDVLKSPKQVFISYIAPIHYNSVISIDKNALPHQSKHTAYATKK
mmetsp:Transcript_11416/g.29112  ORF Transcript_11416/g.29112 Transcript_11416/m.29112 type:complete len:253 (-) Transcript_11416:1135-1893(-)